MRLNLIIAALAAALTSGSALACEKLHVIEYEMGPGNATLTVNGVFYQQLSGEGANMMNFIAWTLPGKNVIDIAYTGAGEAKFWLAAGCEGQFKTEPVSDKIDLSDGDTTRFSFAQTNRTDQAFAKTSPSDDAGLAEAYAAFRKDVLDRDAPAVIAKLESFIARAEAQGYPREAFVGHLTTAIETGEFDVKDTGRFEAVAGGRVYQHLADDRQPTLQARYPTENGGTFTVPFGTYWTKVNGTWEVIYN
ncbi:MAG: hypothetical protein AAF557_18700 [Pseudomonadota bacterium]